MKIYKCPVCDELSDNKYNCCDEPCGILVADTDDRLHIAELEKQNAEFVAEIEQLKCCGNCNVALKTIYYDCPSRVDCTLGLGYSNVCFWQPRNK